MFIQICTFQVNYLEAKPRLKTRLKARFLNILKKPKYIQVGFQEKIQELGIF